MALKDVLPEYCDTRNLDKILPIFSVLRVPTFEESVPQYLLIYEKELEYRQERGLFADLERLCRTEKEALPQSSQACPVKDRKYKPVPLMALPSMQDIEGEAATLSLEVMYDISDPFHPVDEDELYSRQYLRRYYRPPKLPMQNPPVFPPQKPLVVRRRAPPVLPREDELTFE
jgi:hypothetical protein